MHKIIKASTASVLISILLFLFSSEMHTLSAQGCYWQQEVNYIINVDFNTEKNQFKGQQSMSYTNNSPDTLNQLYMHLYFNAFQPGSMMDERSRSIIDPDERVSDRISQLSADEIGYHKIQMLKQEGKKINFIIEGTILRAQLNEPISPGETAEFSMKYKSQVPLQIRRSGRDNKEGIEYSMTQWYPKIAEYDHHGWHPTPYVGREFYGVWGNYLVRITMDSDYIIGASGTLQNAREVGYGYAGTEFKPVSRGNKLTWVFKAIDVHDFAWAADPDYSHIVREAESGVKMHFFYQENEKTKQSWEKLPRIMDEVFSYLNENNGKYPYETYSFIQGGDGGMEYPMATLITGERPLNSLVGVSVHELLHSWYQGVLATNESYYPWMDEGFTSYFSSYVENYLRKKKILNKREPSPNPFKNNIKSYASFAQSGLEEPMSTHADRFMTNTAYSISSYVKGGVFLHGLRYMMGEKQFSKGMIRYFNRWKFKHPEPEDFIRVMEEQAGMEFSWYLNNMMNTLKTLDYGIDTLVEDGNNTSLRLRKYGALPMPIDFVVRLQNGEKHFYSIPLRSMRGHKSMDNIEGYTSTTLLDDWIWTAPEYDLELPFKKKIIEQITVDPRFMLPDIKRSNNFLNPPPKK